MSAADPDSSNKIGIRIRLGGAKLRVAEGSGNG